MSPKKDALSGNTTMLILRLLAEKELYGYQIIEELARKSENVFQLKTGTLYPILHGLEKDGMVTSYDQGTEHARVRKYYKLTSKGKNLLKTKREEWTAYTKAIGRIMEGGVCDVFA